MDNLVLGCGKLQGYEQTVKGRKEVGYICPWVISGGGLCIVVSKVLREILSLNTLVNNLVVILLLGIYLKRKKKN